MSYVVAIEGEVVSARDAVVPVTDRGFLYGDSVYEVIRTYGTTPFALDEHLERLRRSAEILEIDLPVPVEQIAAEIQRALESAEGEGDKGIRVIITRGGGALGLDPGLAERPRRIVIIFDAPELPPRARRDGVAVALVPTGRGPGGSSSWGAKTGNYLTNLMALRKARERGAFEAIMVDSQGRLAEGTTSNFFIVKEGVLSTPPLAAGILAGITRRHVIALGRSAGVEVAEEELRPLDLYSADEVILTGTMKEVLPVVGVDDVVVGDGLPGPISMTLQSLYQGLTRPAPKRA